MSRYWIRFALLLVLVVFLPEARQSQAQVERLPLADLHFHPEPGLSPEEVLRTMDLTGVRWAGNGVAGGREDDVWAPFLELAPGRFIPFAGKIAIRNLIRDQGEAAWSLKSPEILSYLQSLEQKLRAGPFRGIGELFNNHSMGWRQQYPADSPLMQRLLTLAATYQAPLSVHLEAAPESVAELERLLPMDRRAPVIWAHCGFWADASQVRKMMAQHPNLLCELSNRDDRRPLRRRNPRVPITGFGRRLHSDWKALLEDY